MYHESLLEALRGSVSHSLDDERLAAVAYSGGIDSSILAALATEVAATKCYATVVPGSHDARTVPASAAQEGRALVIVELSDDRLVQLVIEVQTIIGTSDPVPIAYTIPLVAAIGAAEEELVLAGNGADELFGGYAKYITSTNPQQEMEEDLKKAIREAKALERHALTIGKRVGFPFLAQRVQELAHAMPLEQKIRGDSRKIPLKEIARDLGLPSEHRQKKAAQYSSGVLRRMEKLARADGKSTAAWIASLCG